MPPKPAGKADIRSFFTSITTKPKTSPSKNSKSPANGSSTEGDAGKRKKKPMVLAESSDSDSDGPFMSPKATKKAKKEESPKKGATSFATKLKTKVSIPETPLRPIDIGSVFGDKPIQRSKDNPEKRKRTVIEDHSDEDFKATLKQLDEAPVPKKTKVVEKSPKKEKPSPAKEEKSRTSSRTPTKTNKTSLKDSPKKVVEVKKEPVSDKKKTVDLVSPEKVTPKKEKSDAKQSGGKKEKDLDSNSNKTTPKSSKKIKAELTIVKETPTKGAHLDDSVMESPSYDPLEKRRQQAENYKRFIATHKEGAKNPGCKPVPEGAPGCLSGLTVVVTGVLESLHREEAEELVKKYGGKPTKSVSKKTSYVLAGEDAGPSKLAKAKDHNVPIISEDDFLNMIATRPASSSTDVGASPAGKKVPVTPKSSKKSATTVKTEPVTPTSKPSVASTKTTPTKKKSSPEVKKTLPPPTKSETADDKTTVEAAPKQTVESTLPWVEKYKPTSLKQVIGMHGDRSIAKKLVFWLKNWYDNRKKNLPKPSLWATNDDGGYFKAALLSGPPGIGKTTTAHLAAKELGYDMVEMNASDTRSKRLLHEHVTELLSTQSLASYAHGSAHIEGGRKRVLVMDEVDGMAGTEDRGGVAELIGLIKSSKIPIICICNDRQHPKIRSLVNYCYDLKFSKPRLEQIRGAMMSICYKEGLQIKPEALDEIITGANQDVRQVLHHLSMLASDRTLSTDKAKVEASKARKDMKISPFDVVRKVFSAEEHRTMSIHDKVGLFFQDYSFGPLFVQENYPMVTPSAAKGDPKRTLDLLGRTAHSISETDLIDKVVRSQNAWSLLPVEAMFASVVPGQLMEGFVNSNPAFPSWLGKNSRRNKMDRLLQELQLHMRLRISGSKRAVNLDYLPYIVDAIVGPLKRSGADGVGDSIRAMENYDLMREDLESLLELAQWPKKPDIMDGVESKVKAAFTRAYNKSNFMTPYAVVQAAKGRSRGGGGATSAEDDAMEGGGLGDEEEQVEDDAEEDEDPTRDAMIVSKKKPQASKTTAKASSSGSGAAAKKKAAAPAATRGRGGGGGRGRKKAAE